MISCFKRWRDWLKAVMMRDFVGYAGSAAGVWSMMIGGWGVGCSVSARKSSLGWQNWRVVLTSFQLDGFEFYPEIS